MLPTAIKPHVFTNLAWDNIDRSEETLSGKGTSHRVNGIAVQKSVDTEQQQLSLPIMNPKDKKRTINSVTVINEHQLEVYISGERVGPEALKIVDNPYVNRIIKTKVDIAEQKNLIWTLLRQFNADNQTVPGWTGFNILTRHIENLTEDVISYLPTINAPPTELSTVFHVLKQSELIRQHLSLNTVVVVMDQALYTKAAEIVWKRKEQFQNIVLRLGTFHTICNVLGIIGKRFKDAGLRDLCIESGIVAEGSLRSVLEGKMYNRAVRTHKCIYEALMRLMWNKFVNWLDAKSEQKENRLVLLRLITNLTEILDQTSLHLILEREEF